MFQARIASAAFTASLILAAAGAAQTLQIVHTQATDKRGNEVSTIDFEIAGKVGANARLFGCLGKATSGAQIPGLGIVYLDMRLPLLDLGRIKIDRSGVGRLRFTAPTTSLSGLVLTAQAIVETKPGTVQLTSWSGIGSQSASSFAGSSSGVTIDYDAATGTLEIVATGAAGDRVLVYQVPPKGWNTNLAWGNIPKTRKKQYVTKVKKVKLGPNDKIVVMVGKTRYEFTPKG